MNEDQNNEYVDFVLKSIETYRNYSDKLTSDDFQVYPQDVQYLLASYQSAKFGLLAEKHRRLQHWRLLSRQFKRWWNTKVDEARTELTANIKAGGKFPALKEYSIKAEEAHKQEYSDWQDRVEDAEDKYKFMEDLKKDWDEFQTILSSLNSNMKSELKSLSIDRYETKPVTLRTRIKKDEQ